MLWNLLWWLIVLMSRIPTWAWLYVTKTMSKSSSLWGYSSLRRTLTVSRACWGSETVTYEEVKKLKKSHSKPMQICATLTLTKGKAGPGAKGSFSCSIWYLRYSSTPFCSNTFCSRSVRNKTREDTATVTAFSGFGWWKTESGVNMGINPKMRKQQVKIKPLFYNTWKKKLGVLGKKRKGKPKFYILVNPL